MYKRIGTKKLGRTMAHRKALVLNLVRSLLENGKIQTTTVKAKVVKGEVDSLLSKVRLSKDGDLNVRKNLRVVFGDAKLVTQFIELSKKEDTKLVLKKIGFRAGDNSEVSMLEITGMKAKKSLKKKLGKKKEEVSQEQQERKNLLNLGDRKTISKRVEPSTKERAKSRSGL